MQKYICCMKHLKPKLLSLFRLKNFLLLPLNLTFTFFVELFEFLKIFLPAFTCSKSTMKTIEKCVKFAQS